MLKRNILIKLIASVLTLVLAVCLWYPTADVNVAFGEAATGDLVAHWTFDGNYDETAQGLKTELGAKQLTYTDGVYGKAAVFNGKDNYLFVKDDSLNLGNGKNDNNDNFTISAWVNLGDSKNSSKYLLDKGEYVGWDKDEGYNYSNPYAIYFDGAEPGVDLSNEYYDGENDTQTEGNNRTNGKWVEGNEWFLLTVTYDGSRVKLYYNNELLTQSNYTDGISFNNEALYIGVDGRLQYYFKGAVDDLRIYSKTLSYDAVEQLYKDGVSSNKELLEPSNKVVAYYPLDGNLSDESSFKNDAEKVATSGSIKYVAGANGKAITMTKGSYIRVPAANQLNFEDKFTVSFWLKNAKDGEAPIFYQQNPAYTDTNDNEYTYSIYINSWEKGNNTGMTFYRGLYSPDNWAPDTGYALGTDLYYEQKKLKNTDWNHYTYTYDDGQLKCYVNGKLQNKSDKSDYVDIENATGDLLIGYDGETFLTGTLDEIKIFNYCASADEVKKEAKRVDTISLSSADSKGVAVGKGKSYQIKDITLKDGDTKETSTLDPSNKDIQYNTSNKKIFKVSKDGKITGVKAGKAKLTISYGAQNLVVNVTVK